jgi:hypothetical protein
MVYGRSVPRSLSRCYAAHRRPRRIAKQEMPSLRVTVIGLAIAGASACEPSRDLELPVAPPLKEARVFETSLFIELTPQATMADAVVLSIAPLVPGMTLTDAQRSLGAPTSTRSDVQCVYYRFNNTPAGVELSHCKGNGSGGGRWEKWRVAASPADSRVSSVFSKPVADLIGRVGQVAEITIHEGDERAATLAFSARIVDGRVSSLEWFNITDFRMEKRLHNNEMKLTRSAPVTGTAALAAYLGVMRHHSDAEEPRDR